MDIKLVEVTLHIDEATTHDDREAFRDFLLGLNGVMAAAHHDEKPHLMLVGYDPDTVKAIAFVDAGKARGLNVELIGL